MRSQEKFAKANSTTWFSLLNLVLNYTKIADIPKKGNRAFWLHAAALEARSSSLELARAGGSKYQIEIPPIC
jgi:hypothetical protein